MTHKHPDFGADRVAAQGGVWTSRIPPLSFAQGLLSFVAAEPLFRRATTSAARPAAFDSRNP